MQPAPFLILALAGALLPGCGGSGTDSTPPAASVPPLLAPEAPAPGVSVPEFTPPTANAARALVATALVVDATARTAAATITLEASPLAGATLEIGDLDISAVDMNGQPLPWADRGDRLDLGLPASATPSTVTIHYRFQAHEDFNGASAGGFTFTWPYHCGNLFPCHSQPAQGQDLSLAVHHPPAGQRVVQATGPVTAAPAYQLAWALGDYTDLDLGFTTAGTRLLASYLPGQQAPMQQGTVHLKAAFQWLESTLGPYRFGGTAGPVSVAWGSSAFGGIEHHPRWHIGGASLADPEVHVHEAIHGWFGNGVRLACWEDFVLSEGTTSYLTARALDVVAPEAGARTWARYAVRLRGVKGSQPVWPASCQQVDILRDGLYTQAPYLRGAFFYQAVAGKIGAPALDRVLARFYRTHAGRAAGMQDMLDTIQSDTGFDPTACANRWLRSAMVPAVGACP